MIPIKYFYFFYSFFLLKLIFQINNIRKTQLLLKKEIIHKKYNDRNKWIIYHLCYLSFTSFVTFYVLSLK